MNLKDKEKGKEKLSNYQEKKLLHKSHTSLPKKIPKYLINYNTDPLALYSSSLSWCIYQYKWSTFSFFN